MELRRLHPDGRVDFQEPHKQDECTRKIAEIGCKRRSHNKPAEDADEEVAEGHIEKGCDSKGLERQTGDAHRAEDGRFEIVEQDGRKREEIDTQEQHCLAKCLFRHKQEPEQRLCGNLSDDGHSNAHKGHEHGGMHGLRDRILVAPADSSGNRHVGAKGNADKEANQKARDRRVRADGSHAEGSEISREPANHHRVNQVRELLQDACGCNRKGKTQDRCPEIAMKDIDRLCRSPRSCHRILSLNMHAPPLPHPVQSTARAGWRYGNGMSPLSSSCRGTYGTEALSIKRASRNQCRNQCLKCSRPYRLPNICTLQADAAACPCCQIRIGDIISLARTYVLICTLTLMQQHRGQAGSLQSKERNGNMVTFEVLIEFSQALIATLTLGIWIGRHSG